MLNAVTNVRFWEQTGQRPTAAYQSRFMSTRPSQLDGDPSLQVERSLLGVTPGVTLRLIGMATPSEFCQRKAKKERLAKPRCYPHTVRGTPLQGATSRCLSK